MINQINCLECKYHTKRYYYEGLEPIIMKDCICEKGYEKTTYNTPFKELKNFKCNDFERKLYWKILRFLHLNEEIDYSGDIDVRI